MDEKDPKNVFDDPDAPVSEEERAASERLRDALADPSVSHADADFARVLALANAPREIDAKEHAEIVTRAVAKAKPRGRVLRVSFAVGGVLALAAAAVLVLGQIDARAPQASQTSQASQASAVASPALVPARSTQELFNEPFAQPLSADAKRAASARIDRIAMAREGDLRENRFAMWGVR